jgi:hypothetical protein
VYFCRKRWAFMVKLHYLQSVSLYCLISFKVVAGAYRGGLFWLHSLNFYQILETSSMKEVMKILRGLKNSM